MLLKRVFFTKILDIVNAATILKPGIHKLEQEFFFWLKEASYFPIYLLNNPFARSYISETWLRKF